LIKVFDNFLRNIFSLWGFRVISQKYKPKWNTYTYLISLTSGVWSRASLTNVF